MRRSTAFLLATGAAVLLVACSDESKDSSLVEPSAQSLVGTGAACRPSDVARHARTLFGGGSAEASLANSITTNQTTNVPIGFSLFRAVSDLRQGTPTWTTSQSTAAANLTVSLIWCMDVATTAPVAQITVTNFEGAFGTKGMYEVRGGNGDPSGPAAAFDANSFVEPATGSTFADFLGGPALIYGREIGLNGLAAGAGRKYEIALIRQNKTAPLGLSIRSLCLPSADVTALRIEHQAGSANTILPDVVSLAACGVLAAAPESPTGAAWLFARAKALLLPQVAFARAGTGIKSGSATSFSPHWLVNPGAVTLAFTQQPVNGFTNTPQTVVVSATGQNANPALPGVAWEGVDIRLDAFNNNGSWVCSSGNIAQTNAQGIATFPNFSVNKPGGYKIVATTIGSNDGDGVSNGDYSGTATSNRFNLQQGTTSSSPGDTCQ